MTCAVPALPRAVVVVVDVNLKCVHPESSLHFFSVTRPPIL